ncbi:MAG: tripartite tricarboxylate transporter TctB family protein [Desulfuromonadales bacterium]
MEKDTSSLFAVKINFAESHTFFPTIVLWVLVFLLLLIFIFNGIPYLRALSSGRRQLNFSVAHIDKLRLLGTLVLTVVYFLLMEYVGTLFPNMGYGFLFVSVPFILLLSMLYVHNVTRRKIVIMLLNAVIAPCIAWYVLARLFNITLP